MSENGSIKDIVDAASEMVKGSNRDKVAAYLAALPAWPAPELPGETAEEPDPPVDESRDGRTFTCTSTPYDLTSNPEKIVMFEPDVATTWPGALVQGKHLLGLGSFRELPIKKRSPLQVSVDLLVVPNTKSVSKPTASSVRSAIAEIIEPLDGRQVDFGSSLSFLMTETYSLEQSLVELGVSAKFAGSELKTRHRSESSYEKHVLSASIVQKCFTVYVDNPATPADLFTPDFSLRDLTEQENAKRIGRDNIPVMLSSVTYGRMLYMTISSTRDYSEIHNALSASVNSGSGGGSGDYGEEHKKLLIESQMRITGTGVEEKKAKKLIIEGKIGEFFSDKLNLSSVKPISLIFYNLADLSIAAITDTAHYNITVCVPKRVEKPSNGTAKRASRASANLRRYYNFAGAAAGNWSDLPTRGIRLSQAKESHANFIEEINWFYSNASSLTGDDRVWLTDWGPSILIEIERQYRAWKRGFDGNTSDTGTRSVYQLALNLSSSQRVLLVALLDELRK
ncbi:thiol-activated cytolysin family protein [Sinorhizobium meliloti]|uniref:thiol-activated cytolysin family protein n=1 Tax=Rhizobium meliloti TaxID=382 RepID=UPI00040905B3|nr:thiol-activated cytolysin family protein [Sinorhizobium meliloti]MDE4620841.1 thiol-activated cytolysin family protein [Sinorhizobium meliloti]